MSERTGGREAVEDAPVTGATEEQIKAAAVREWGNKALDDPLSVKVVAKYARMLVPVDHAIVRAEDALTAEDRSVILALCDEAEACVLAWDADVWRKSIEALTKTVRAIAAGGPA